MAMTAQTKTTHLGYRLVDADNHYYEPHDCFTRHLDPQFADRAIQTTLWRRWPSCGPARALVAWT